MTWKLKTSLLILLILPFLASGQQLTSTSLMGQNLFDINPAAAGMYGRSAVTIRHRAQWGGFEGAPSWSFLSFHTPINQQLALGFRVHQEEIAAFKSLNASGGLAWKTPLRKGQLAFALEAGMQRLEIDQNALIARDGNDAWLFTNQNNQSLFNMQFGFLYRSKKAFLGASVQQLVPSSWGFIDDAEGTQVMHVHVHGGTKIPLNPRLELRPNVNLRFVPESFFHPEAQIGLNLDQRFTLGGGYRWSGDAYAMAEVQIKKSYRLAYLYEMSTGPLAALHNGTHELFIGILFGKLKSSSIKSFTP